MHIKKNVDAVRAYARIRKQRLLSDADHLLLVLREGEVVAVLNSRELNELIGVAETAAAGYGADGLALVVEGVVPLVAANPITGHEWKRGEAESVWRDHDGAREGWVTEVQIRAVALRTGETVDEMWPFHLRNGAIAWGEPSVNLPVSGLSKAMATRMARPIADTTRVPDPGDGFAGDPVNGPFYSPEEGRVVLDIGCTRILARQLTGEACLMTTSHDRADYLISEGLPQWQVEVAENILEED